MKWLRNSEPSCEACGAMEVRYSGSCGGALMVKIPHLGRSVSWLDSEPPVGGEDAS